MPVVLFDVLFRFSNVAWPDFKRQGMTSSQYYFSLTLDLILCLVGADFRSNCVRYALRRPSTEGRSGVIPVLPLSLGVEELVFVSCESRPDRKSFFGGPA